MPTRSISDRKLDKMRREGRGHGEGSRYRPGATVWEDRRAKRVHRVPFNGRQAHLPRDCRFAAFLLECYQDDTIDIHESLPCDLSSTIEIACAMKLRHPQHVDGSFKTLITDLLVIKRCEENTRQEAISVRLESKSKRKLNIELKIIERYWTLKGVPWRLQQNQGLNSNWARNLDFLYAIASRPERAGVGAGDPSVQRAILRAIVVGGQTDIRTVCGFVMRNMGRPPVHGINAYHLLLAAKRIRFDLDCEDIDREPLSQLHVENATPVTFP